ncbi:hypothetical protein AAVH_20400 [Aphelenchoides avenae]|nr:hypothetical protein AAVH_20400 [Aphelenchus avenae]
MEQDRSNQGSSQGRSSPDLSNQDRNNQAHSSPGLSNQDRSNQGSSQAHSSPDLSNQVLSSLVRSNQDRSSLVRSSPDRSSHSVATAAQTVREPRTCASIRYGKFWACSAKN